MSTRSEHCQLVLFSMIPSSTPRQPTGLPPVRKVFVDRVDADSSFKQHTSRLKVVSKIYFSVLTSWSKTISLSDTMVCN